MIELIALIIFFSSLAGMGVIVYRKIPLLLELPETPPSKFKRRDFLLKTKNSIPLKGVSIEIFLQKILSKIRILTLKTDNKTSSWLEKLRTRSQKNKFNKDDNYWQEIKKSTKK